MSKETEISAQKIQLLLKEHERASSDIRSIESMNDKVIGLGITLIGTGFTFGAQYEINEVFVFLPVAFVGVFFYATLQYHNMFWIGGYKRAVEEKINELHGATVFYWEELVQTRRGRLNVIHLGLSIVYTSLLLFIIIYSAKVIFDWKGASACGVFAGGVSLLLLVLAFAIRRMAAAYQCSYRQSQKSILPVRAAGNADCSETVDVRVAY